MSKFFLNQPIKFQCIQCGKCCDVENGVVYLTGEDQIVIADFLEMSLKNFQKEFLKRNGEGIWEIRDEHPSRCRFLVDNQCSIYPVRPLQCRLYPFWSTILNDCKTFYSEPCPGIGKGEAMDISLIKTYYVLHRNFLSQLNQESIYEN